MFDRLERLRRIEAEADPEAVDRIQLEALTRVLDLAMTVPYYGDQVSPTARTRHPIDRLRSFPVLEKRTVQSEAARLKNPGWDGRGMRKTTGGSTGRPVTIAKNADAVAQEMAATWLGYGWAGIRIGDPCIRFWGRPVRNMKRRLRYLAADAAMNRRTLSAFGYDRTDLRRYLGTIERFRPRYLYGYVSALEDLAGAAWEAGAELPSLTAVVTTSEVLTDPQRRTIERGFGVRVQNEYGCGEVGPIAYECPAGSLHLLPTNQFVEIVDSAGEPVRPGEPGTILITDLTNEAMPLIRYRVGDTGSPGQPCSCGRPFATLENVFGREYDFVLAPDGRRYHGEFFMYAMEDLRSAHRDLGKFKVIQTGPRDLEVHVVAEESVDEALAAIQEEFQRRLAGFNVSVERKPHLAPLASGKTRIVENRLVPTSSSASR